MQFTDSSNPFDGTWHHYRFTWDITTDVYRVYQDNILISEEDTACSSPTISGIKFGGDLTGDLCEVYITNNPNTPQIPTANGVPLDMPIVRND